ncbi:hypothetical protein ACIRBX_18130 [Kitasatospora sp. NPDC096147]|uniref:hypothetical protein n=1 Tax=Kitasatospora sp. NPDC096147 TaxID=3364093 RepID=UPI00381FA777
MRKYVKLVTAAALLLPITAAGAPAAAAPAARTPLGEVDSFFSEYRLAALGEIEEYPAEIRARTLSPPLNAELDAWSAIHGGADPVFRERSIPRSWSLREAPATLSSPGAHTVSVTETWYEGGSREVLFTVRLPDLRITAINDAPRWAT